MKTVLTIAGSDSGGGAGIQADLKAFAARGVLGTSALTAVTVQNTLGVLSVFVLPVDLVAQQIDAVMNDIGADAWKTGMLGNTEIIRVVAARARRHGVEYLVVDPVLAAKGGIPLLGTEARKVLVEELLPLAYLVTPNLDEAQVLTGLEISSVNDMQRAAEAILAMGARYVVIKGGHLAAVEVAIDVLYDGRTFTTFTVPRVHTANTHGTGCTLASAIAAELAQGYPVREAVRNAKGYLTAALQSAANWRVGHGHGPLDHFPQPMCVEVGME